MNNMREIGLILQRILVKILLSLFAVKSVYAWGPQGVNTSTYEDPLPTTSVGRGWACETD